MASERTAEEVEREYLAKLGPKLGALFWHLRNEATWLRAYPKTPAARKVIQAQAKCSMAS